MDHIAEPAAQFYDGGIIFVSYLISVAGAQTTLELLNRRTHIRGLYNWFLLAAAAFVMGAVAIWSMHFIGNNSMTLIVQGNSYQLDYHAGYTFGSLVVAIACMFLAFISVGITEEVKVSRIIPSGIFAGLGIVCMHYMGQFAIDYFVMVYKVGYIIGAAIIAMSAVTVALYIFFKLRERWMNAWYKRLGCAMLMATAVCGMHYTALVGTTFYRPYGGAPPVPKLQTPALIGIISAVIVSACVGLLYISVKTGMKNLPRYTKNTNKRLILDAVIFDPIGRILVKVDGTLPMTEVVHELDKSSHDFNTNHPLFIRLYELAMEKASMKFQSDERPSGVSNTSSSEIYDIVEKQFLEACHELKDDLRLSNNGDLGILSEIVVGTDTISKANRFTKSSHLFKNASGQKKKGGSPSIADIETALQQQHHQQSLSFSDDDDHLQQQQRQQRVSKENKKNIRKSMSNWSVKKSYAGDEELGIENTGNRSSSTTTVVASSQGASGGHRSSSEDTRQEDAKSVNNRLSVEDSDGEDKHIFLVRKLDDERDVSKLLSQGYRFAEPIFIAKTMASKLRIPTDWMRQHFLDMQQLADSICGLTQHDWFPSAVEPAPNPTVFKASTRSSVYVGAFLLIDETKELTGMQIAIDKTRRYAFPMEQLTYDHPMEAPAELNETEINFIKHIQGLSLFEVAGIRQAPLNEFCSEDELPGEMFLRSLENAARTILDSTSYSKALYQSSKLHMTVLDLPPFALTTGPCQLIVFKSFVNTQGAVSAVNHTFTEPMKCVPLKIYKLLSGFITTEAARIYQSSSQTLSPPTYLLQQQMYRQQTSNYEQKKIGASSSGDEEMPMSALHVERIDSRHSGNESPLATTPTSTTIMNGDPFSLPPPPRAKRSRFKLTNTILNSSPFDILSPIHDQQKAKSSSKSIATLQSAPLTILTTRDRYWWINSIVEETIHSNMD